MAKAPAIANVKTAEVGKTGAVRSGKTAAGTKRSKDGNPDVTFEKALKRAGEAVRRETRAVDGLRKSSGPERKPRHRETILLKKTTSGEKTRVSTAERRLSKTESVLGDVGKRNAGKPERPEAAEEKAAAAADGAKPAAMEIGLDDEILADAAGSAFVSEDRDRRGRIADTDSRSSTVHEGGAGAEMRRGSGKNAAEVLGHKASRIIVEDKRVSGGKMRSEAGRSIRVGGKGGERNAPGEPVTFRLEGGGSAGSQNGFAVAETDIDLSPRGVGRSAIENASAELSRKLDAQAGNEIVRQVKVILNRADAGEVRINLRPENLGRVRVRIQMEDNRLTGRIFVESAAAREAFRGALDGLQAKLVESGFGSADLELAWDEGRSDLSQFDRGNGRGTKNSGEASLEFEGMSATVEQEDVRIGDGRVDMVV